MRITKHSFVAVCTLLIKLASVQVSSCMGESQKSKVPMKVLCFCRGMNYFNKFGSFKCTESLKDFFAFFDVAPN